MKRLLSLAVLVGLAVPALADDTADLISLGMNPELVKQLSEIIPAFDAANFARNIQFASGYTPQLAAGVVVTPVATATAPAGGISTLVSVIATAAPTANYIKLPATPVAGGTYYLANRSANPVVMIPGGTSSMTNGATFSCATGKLCQCHAVSASELSCQ